MHINKLLLFASITVFYIVTQVIQKIKIFNTIGLNIIPHDATKSFNLLKSTEKIPPYILKGLAKSQNYRFNRSKKLKTPSSITRTGL
ncbi:MAG: hypothetical protein D5R97_07020 [Candidatus Syntrophonatronum acetioxidans]|uniref:Uncharacterized protein n=1 Tax=Candidatus Syntrophonatronum acetioxidans TaxID=1795816 RepID=A0A424YDH1_9FIRM|nr:MAG: hypothetical protein D5R97_07020 [Candidatus Syntrophonatronum acetioxidans]